MDITPLAASATSTPEQAASNIQTASIFSINPTDNKELNQSLAPAAKKLTAPTEVEPPIHEYASQSTEHAAVISGEQDGVSDIHKLNYVSRLAKYFGDKLGDQYTVGQKVGELGFKQMMNNGKLNDEEEGNLFQANQDRKALADRNYDLAGPEKPPEDMFDMRSDVEGFAKGAAKLTADAVAGTINFARGVPRGALDMLKDQSLPYHGIRGLIGRAAIGALGFRNIVGSTYNELSNAQKDDGTPVNMDEATKRHLSVGVGAVNMAIMGLAPEVAESVLPAMTTLTPKFVAMAMEAPENAVMRMAIHNIGHSAFTMGAMGGMSEATNLVKEEMEKNYDGTHASFVNALVTASEKVATNKDKYLQRLGGAAGEQAFTGALLGIGGNVLSKGAMRSQVDAIAEQGRDLLNNISVTRTSSPAGLIEGEAPPRPESKPGAPPEPGPEPRRPMKDVTPIRPNVGDEVPIEQTVQHAHDALEFHEGLHTINDAMASTNLEKISPEESVGVLKKIFDHAGITKLYTTLSNARMFSRTEEQGRVMRGLLDPSGRMNGAMDAPIAVDPVKVMEVAKKYPEIIDHFSPSPLRPNPLQAGQHLQNLLEAEQRRGDILGKLGVTPEEIAPPKDVTPTKIEPKAKGEKVPYDLESDVRRTQEILDEKKSLPEGDKKLTKLDKELEEIKARVTENFKKPEPGKLLFGHWAEPDLEDSMNAMSGYLEAPTFTEALRKALPKAEVERIDAAQARAREARSTSIADAAKYEMDKVHDVHVAEAREIRRQQEIDRIANDPNYAIVDKFRNTKDAEKKSIYQIDPKTLTKDQLEYADHYRMKEHGVFAKKGGMPADSAAQLLEVKDGTELLRILAQTPTREQVARAREAANAVADEKEVRSHDDLNHTKIIEAIRDTARNHLEEMKFMREQEWPATKAGIKRIALPLPKIEALEEQARQIVSQMKVGELNERQYEVGENRANRLAVNAILKNEVEAAFIFKENAAMNALIRKEVMIQTGLANRAFSFFRKVNSAATQQLLRDAGKLPYEAMKELQDLWKLSPSTAGQAEIGSFRKWVKKEVESGRGDFSIPERLNDLRQSANDMTTEQLMAVWDRGRVILNEAKFKNKLRGMGEARDAEARKADIERIEAEVVERVKARTGSDISRVKPPTGPINYAWRKFKTGLATMEAAIAGRQNIIRELDDGKTGGFFHETFIDQFEGSGKFKDKKGYSKALNGAAKIEKWISEAKKTSTVDTWEQTWLDVPEFHNIKELKYGKMTKADLAMAHAYRGQQYTKDLLTENNGGISDETWQTVLDRHLEPSDVDFIQKVVDRYKEFRPEIKDQQERDGRDVTFIEGIPNKHRNVVYDGGWVRARYEHEYTRGAAEQLKEFLDNKDSIQDEKKQGASYGRQWAAETTHQGYTMERTGSRQPLDLNFRGLFDAFHEINHDLAYRDPGRNFMQLLSRPDVYDAFVEGVGKEKTDTLIQQTIKLLDQPSQRTEGYFSNFNRFTKDLFRKFGRNYAITTLWGNGSTVIKQVESLAEQFNALGPKGIYHFVRMNAFMLRHLDKASSYFAIAEQLDPNMRKYFSGVEDTAANTVEGLIPRKTIVPAKMNWLVNAGKMAETVGFTPIMMTDYYLKGLQAHTVMSMILSDHHPDIRVADFEKLSPQEQMEKAQSMIQQLSSLTQIQSRPETQAAVQDNLLTKPFVFFWNYQRNILNNTILDARRAKWKYQDSYENFKEGEKMDAAKDFGSGTGIIMSRMIWAFVGLSITKYAAGQSWDFAKKTINNIDDLAEAGVGFMKHLMMSPVEQVADTLPIENSIKWGIEHKKKYSMVEVQNPLGQGLASIGTCITSLDNMMSLSRHMTRMQVRACLQAESYIAQPLPVNGFYKAMKAISQPSSPSSGILSLKTVDNLVEHIKEYVNNPPSSVSADDVASLDAIGKALAADSTEIPKGMADSVKLAESGGNWSKPNGLYGFSSDQWKSIQKSAPELGLTDAGRNSKDTTQQEKAIEWSLKDNAEKLVSKDIPVNENTLFGAHKLGMDNYEKLFKASGDAKLKTVLGNDFLEKNPDLGQFKTVGQVKQYLNSTMEQARKGRQETAKLTLPTNNAED